MVYTGGEVLSDGSVLELIQGPKHELKLLSWDGKIARTADKFVRGEETFGPLEASWRFYSPDAMAAPTRIFPLRK